MAERRSASRVPPGEQKTEAAAAPPTEDKVVLTEVQKLKLFNVHLKDKLLLMEKQSAEDSNTIAQLQAEILRLKKVVHEAEVAPIYKELGIKRGDALELHDDGTLIVNPKQKKPQELFQKVQGGKGNGAEKELEKK
jgi:hypothetical protein